METLLQSTNLVKRAYWLIKLRWVAICLLGVTTFISNKILLIELPVVALYSITICLFGYNFLLYDLLNYYTWKGKNPSHRSISKIITLQISADLFILTMILHFSGGIENPFFLYFVFHMIIASILLSSRQSYFQATLAVVLFCSLVILESAGVITHYSLPWFRGYQIYRNSIFIFGTLWIFSTTLYLVVYMTTSISQQFRKQQEGFERTNALLKEKDHLKNEYVLRLTHDIRGHLAAIQGCLNIVDDRIVGPLNEKQSDLIGRAYRRADKCMSFVTMLLKLTRMKLTGELDMYYFSLKNIFFDSFAAVEKRATRKNIRIDYEIEQTIDRVYGEPALIEEAITNLLFNALRYTPENGSVKLTAKDKGDYVLLEVSDTGIGIPPDEIDKIFEEFYRASNARKVERDGTGLGLSIAKQVIERHSGKIWAKNNKKVGSTFSFTLPKTPAKAPSISKGQN